MNTEIIATITVPTFNQENYIAETLDSLVSQETDFKYEILVGDDCSIDKTADIIKKYEVQYPDKIKVFENKVNQGILKNYNRLMNAAKGKYIAGCGGDDIWHDPLKLKKQVDFLERNQEYAMVHTDYDRLFESGIIIHNFHKENTTIPQDEMYYHALMKNNFILASSTCTRAESYRKYIDIEDFIKHGFAMEDLPMWLEFSKHSKIGYLPESTVTYREHGESISNNQNYRKAIKYLESSYKARTFYMKKYSCSDDVKKEFRIEYHTKMLSFAFKLRDRALGKKSYSKLLKLEKERVDSNIRWQIFGLNNLVCWLIAKFVFKLKN